MFLHTNAVTPEFFRTISEGRVLSREEEIRLVNRIKRGNRRAYEEMVKNNQKLVLSIVSRFCRNESQMVDLMQEGNIGLMKAIRRFSTKKRVKFSTYATWWIRHHVVSALQVQSNPVRIPVRKMRKLQDINRFTVEYLQKNGRMPTVKEIAREVALTEKMVQAILKLGRGSCNFDIMTTEMEQDHVAPDNLEYTVSEPEPEGPFQQALNSDVSKLLRKVLDDLPDRMRKIITYRYGIDDGVFRTLKETGKHFLLSAEAIRLYEKRAFEHIRRRHPGLRELL